MISNFRFEEFVYKMNAEESEEQFNETCVAKINLWKMDGSLEIKSRPSN